MPHSLLESRGFIFCSVQEMFIKHLGVPGTLLNIGDTVEDKINGRILALLELIFSYRQAIKKNMY